MVQFATLYYISLERLSNKGFLVALQEEYSSAQ
jgi:hypothetical protein